jgi:lactoylglutathione lyase
VEIDRFGIILNVENFDDCVSFYKSLFGLKEMFIKRNGDFRLTCLEYGSAYLMIETGGIASESEKTILQNSAVLRFNVEDTQVIMDLVLHHDKTARRIETDWGYIIRCIDPDGNPISIRESVGFEG